MKLLGKFLCQQWWLLLIAMPFLFLGSITDFFFPDFVGRIVQATIDLEYAEADKILTAWVIFMIVSAVAGAIRDVIMGATSQRLGTAMRQALFRSLIHQDVAFFDDNHIGDIRKFSLCKVIFKFSDRIDFLVSRMDADTQVVQDGLT